MAANVTVNESSDICSNSGKVLHCVSRRDGSSSTICPTCRKRVIDHAASPSQSSPSHLDRSSDLENDGIRCINSTRQGDLVGNGLANLVCSIVLGEQKPSLRIAPRKRIRGLSPKC